jgi:hypothetical protein
VGLQRAFGRDGCAEQSVISETLNASTGENVEQMREAMKIIYRTYGEGYRHNYEECWQVVDVDMTGMPAGRKGEGVTKGYFSGHRGRPGRQLGRVVATLYDEIVVERRYPGTVQLERSLQELVEAAELAGFGPLRMVRDLFHISGKIIISDHGKVLGITLNQAHALASSFIKALSPYLARDGTWLDLGQIWVGSLINGDCLGPLMLFPCDHLRQSSVT